MDPLIDRKLLQWLEKEFPNQMPGVELSIDEIRVKQGEQRVMQYLRLRLEAQEEIAMDFI